MLNRIEPHNPLIYKEKQVVYWLLKWPMKLSFQAISGLAGRLLQVGNGSFFYLNLIAEASLI